MINVSNEFKKLMNTRTDFKENAEITFSDGTVLALTEKDFTVSNNGVTDAAETNGIPLGVALCRSVQIELMNDDDRFSEYDFYGAKIQLFLTFQLSETVEKIEYGTFTVLTPETYGETVIITALDDMRKADKSYETTLVYPATLGAIWADACNGADIQPGTTTFLNDDFVVESKPTDITYRQLFGFIAMIAGGNARIDTTGRLRIITYDFEKLDGIYNAIIDGGRYSPWSNPNSFDGGVFSPWNEGDVLDGGAFSDRADFHVLGNWSNLKVDTDDVVITGVKASYTNEDNEEMSAMYGTEGYVLQIENPLISGKEEDAVALIGNVMVGAKFRQFSGDIVANPTCEFMDPAVVVDRKGNCYISFLTDINFQFFGFTTLKNNAEPALRNSSKTYSEATKTLVAARKLVKNERTARERAVAQLAKDLANSSGLFVTEEKQEDGSSIWYMHDKSSLSESMIVWKLTALAFGVSTDGGKTYPYGFTMDGETITRLLYAEGINADYINAGAIKISDTSGNTLFLADYDTKQVYVNASNVKIGTKAITDELVEMAATISLVDDKVELKASKGQLSSLLSVESGAVTIKSNRFSWESTYSSLSANGKLTAKDVDLTGKITADNGEIGGFTIGDSSIYKNTSSISSTSSGVYLGTDGINLGGKKAVITSAGKASFSDIKITGNGSVSFNNGSYYMNLSYDSIDFGSSSLTTKINRDKVQVYDNYLDSNGLHCGGSVNLYTEIRDNEITLRGTSGYLRIGSNSTTWASSSSTYYLKDNSGDELMAIMNDQLQLYPNILTLGKSTGYLGFFGNSIKSTKKTVSKASTTSTVTASSVATTLNNLIDALKAYNLIG